MGDFRKRVLIPASLPLVAAGFVALLAFAFSRVLLAVPEAGSTILAILMAGMILAVCGVIAASGSGIKRSQKMLVMLGGVALLGAGVAGASLGIREIAPHAQEVRIAAEGLRFDTETLTLPSGGVSLVFENRDATVLHDVDIHTDDSFPQPPLFDGETFLGVATKTYSVPPLEAGTYAFRCSIHVTEMTGTVVVEEGAGGHGPPPENVDPTRTEITAAGIAFDTDLIQLIADAATTITLVNDDTAPHDIQIYPDSTFTGEALFDGEDVAPGETTIYALDPIPPGEYAFRCSIHPTQMLGLAKFIK